MEIEVAVHLDGGSNAGADEIQGVVATAAEREVGVGRVDGDHDGRGRGLLRVGAGADEILDLAVDAVVEAERRVARGRLARGVSRLGRRARFPGAASSPSPR